MKILLSILTFLLFLVSAGAQQDGADDNDRIRDKMKQYIQQRMRLSNDEADKFTPVFIRYYIEWRSTLRETRNDRLILQQKIVELRLRYRTQFREFLGEKRSNEVYRHQEIFIQELKNIRRDRMQKPGRNGTRSTLEGRFKDHSNFHTGFCTS